MAKKGAYFYANGKRKSAIATVTLKGQEMYRSMVNLFETGLIATKLCFESKNHLVSLEPKRMWI